MRASFSLVIATFVFGCAPEPDEPSGEAPHHEPCVCEKDADTCDRTGDSIPATTDICQTWSNVADDRVNLFVEFASDAPLTGLSPAILGFQFDLDLDSSTTPERCAGCSHGFYPNPDDELGDDMIWIGFEEYVYLQPYLNPDGSHT